MPMKRKIYPWWKKSQRTHLPKSYKQSSETNKELAKTYKKLTSTQMIRKKKEISCEIGSWDVEGKGTPEEIDKALINMMKLSLDVVCLQRVCFPAPNKDTSNYKWLCNGTSGSAILLKKSAKLESSSFEQVCDQICMTQLEIKKGSKVNVISCYIPPETDYTSGELWSKLENIIGKISFQYFILTGDFNAQIGKCDVEFSPNCEFYKKRLYHESSNENGKKLTDLMRKYHLKPFLPNDEFVTFKDGNINSQQSYMFYVPLILDNFYRQAGGIVWHPKYKHGLLYYKLRSSSKGRLITEENLGVNHPTVVATWNIQNATPSIIDAVLNQHNLPIVCVQELFLISEDDILTDNYTWLCTKKLWAKNVGVLIKKSPNIVLSTFEPHSEFLCTAKVLYYGKPLIVMSCYLPPMNDSQHLQIVSRTKELINELKEEDLVFLGGDFNSTLNSQGEILHADDFAMNLANETKLCLPPKKVLHAFNDYVSQITILGKRRCHYLFVSQSVVDSMHIDLSFKWIPSFENVIMTMNAKTQEDKLPFSLDRVNRYYSPLMDSKVETVDGVIYKTTTYNYPSQEEPDIPEAAASLVSAEDKEKFKNTPPSAEDLSRMLKDFVFIHRASPRSILRSNGFEHLSKSFSECKLGNLVVEDILEPDEKTGRRITRIKWEDVLLAEQISTNQEKEVTLLKKAALSVIGKIGQTCYSVKASKNYFNNGRQPEVMGTPKADNIIKVVDKKSFSTEEELFRHIDNFIIENSDAELVFGPDFSKKEICQIAQYALNKHGLLEFRLFKSGSDHLPNNLAIYMKRSPQYIRDMLIKEPENFKYFLIPPCGLGNDYSSFSEKIINNYYASHIKLKNQSANDPSLKKPKIPPIVENLKKALRVEKPRDQPRSDKTKLLSRTVKSRSMRKEQQHKDDLSRSSRNRTDRRSVRSPPPESVRSFSTRNRDDRESRRSRHSDDVRSFSSRDRYDRPSERFQLSDDVRSFSSRDQYDRPSERFQLSGDERSLSSRDRNEQQREWPQQLGNEQQRKWPQQLDDVRSFSSRDQYDRPSERFQQSGDISSLSSRNQNNKQNILSHESGGVSSFSSRNWKDQPNVWSPPSGRISSSRRNECDQQDEWSQQQPGRSTASINRNEYDQQDEWSQQQLGRSSSSRKDEYDQQDEWSQQQSDSISSSRRNEYDQQDELSQQQLGSISSYSRNEYDQQDEWSQQQSGRSIASSRNQYNQQDEWSQQQLDGKKRSYSMMNSRQNGSDESSQYFEKGLVSKKPMLEEDVFYRLEIPPWSDVRPLVIVWPINEFSQEEDRPEEVIKENFTVEFKTESERFAGGLEPDTYVLISLTHCNGFAKKYYIAKGNSRRMAAKTALELLVRHCTIIKPNPSFLNNGRTPTFVRFKEACQSVPRTYIILDSHETGRLTPENIQDLIENFMKSFEDELYLRLGYTLEEKVALMEMVQKLAPNILLVRHFGEEQNLDKRCLCIYKRINKKKVLQEILKHGNAHPKYRLITSRLPPGFENTMF